MTKQIDSAKIVTRVVSSQSNPLDNSTPTDNLLLSHDQTYAQGTGADQAQVIFHDTRTVAAGATDSLDLAGGLTHPLGGAITFTAIKEILVIPAAANTVSLLVGEGVTNAFVGPFGASAVGITIDGDGILHVRTRSAAGWTVTAGTGDILAIENLGGSAADYQIVIIGEGTVA